MHASHRESADHVRERIERGVHDRAAFRAALGDVPKNDRDGWLDHVLALDMIPEDDRLPAGCVPYLPSPVDALLRVIDQARVRANDVVIDVGSGVGRAGAFFHLMTGARVMGLEIQPRLVRASRELAARVSVSQMSCIEGDAVNLTAQIAVGSIFFLYCPFSGDRLAKLLAHLQQVAREKTIRVCSLDLPIPACEWLVREPPFAPDLAVFRSTHRDEGTKEIQRGILKT